jgi:hypothetical protein
VSSQAYPILIAVNSGVSAFQETTHVAYTPHGDKLNAIFILQNLKLLTGLDTQ